MHITKFTTATSGHFSIMSSRTMKANCTSLFSSLLALLFAGFIVSTRADDSTTRDLKAAANIQFDDIVPQPDQQTTDRTFSAKVEDRDGLTISEVKLLYKPQGQDKFNTEKLEYTGNDNIWALEIEGLDFGSYEWYLEAKNEDKGKRKSTDDFPMLIFELSSK
jgi:hypothetical protein